MDNKRNYVLYLVKFYKYKADSDKLFIMKENILVGRFTTAAVVSLKSLFLSSLAQPKWFINYCNYCFLNTTG